MVGTLGPVRTLFLVYFALVGTGDPMRTRRWIELKHQLELGDADGLCRLVEQGTERAGVALEWWRTRPEGALALLNEVTENLAYGPAFGHWQHRDVILPAAQLLKDLDRQVRASEACGWWWQDAAPCQMLTEGRTGRRRPFEPSRRGERWGWWVAPEGPRTAVTTRGPVGSAASVAAVCRDGHYVPPNEPAVLPYDRPPGSILEIRTAEDWAH